jgi:hypothetical protein
MWNISKYDFTPLDMMPPTKEGSGEQAIRTVLAIRFQGASYSGIHKSHASNGLL